MKATRLNDIENLLEEQNTISINRLCEIFNVSKNTIRRDIVELEKRGTIKKVYGGIMRNQTNIPEPFAAREIKNKAKKKQLAKLAANLVNDNDIIYIDSGTTTMHMVPYLADKKNLTILTANVYVINEAFHYPQMNVIATGGSLYRPSNAFTGASVLQFLKDFNISKCFLAATGISIENGATNASPMEGDIKKYLTHHSKVKILLVDSTKINQVSLVTFSKLKDMDYIISDKKMPKEYEDYFKENDVTLITPENN